MTDGSTEQIQRDPFVDLARLAPIIGLFAFAYIFMIGPMNVIGGNADWYDVLATIACIGCWVSLGVAVSVIP